MPHSDRMRDPSPLTLMPHFTRPGEKPTKPEMVAVRPENGVASVRTLPRKPLPPALPRKDPSEPPPVVVRPEPLVSLTDEFDDDDFDVPTATRDWNQQSMPPVAVERTRAALVRLDPSAAGMTMMLPDHEVSFGRGRDAEIRLDDEGVSRLHARIRPTRTGYEIVDLESRNGTVVGGRMVRHTQLADGDVIQLGPRVSFRFSLMDERQAEVMRQLFEASVRDGLTGAFNRQHLQDRLRGELAFAIRHRSELGLLLLDVDHFKKVNDTHGHQAGDAVLRFVAGAIASRLRTEDLFARYGGEEFVAVLRGIDLAGAARAGERLRSVLSANCPHFEGKTIPVTVSIGAASLSTCREQTVEALIAAADRRLYIAKNSGRNRVVASDDLAR
ncbi:MAG: GGDEF domain-containing protein [Myxococcales bacterium]|nr:GGDEF domain-containing protein [Myxococcales bacterium]